MIKQQRGVILVVVYSKRCDMRENLILTGLDGLVAMDRLSQIPPAPPAIGTGFVLVLPGSGLLGNAT